MAGIFFDLVENNHESERKKQRMVNMKKSLEEIKCLGS